MGEVENRKIRYEQAVKLAQPIFETHSEELRKTGQSVFTREEINVLRGMLGDFASLFYDFKEAYSVLSYYADKRNYATVKRTYVQEDGGQRARVAKSQIDGVFDGPTDEV